MFFVRSKGIRCVWPQRQRRRRQVVEGGVQGDDDEGEEPAGQRQEQGEGEKEDLIERLNKIAWKVRKPGCSQLNFTFWMLFLFDALTNLSISNITAALHFMWKISSTVVWLSNLSWKYIYVLILSGFSLIGIFLPYCSIHTKFTFEHYCTFDSED